MEKPVDRAIVERALAAVRALSGAARTKGESPAKTQTSTAVCDRLEPTAGNGECPGPEQCAGCYSVGVIDGRERFIHPPKASADWEAWLKRWGPKGRIQ
jgi:hypothetical protein